MIEESNMRKTIQKGFTLIELVMVIVILGILAAVAVPQFVDLSSDAQTATTSGIAGALGSAATTNYAACSTPSKTGCISIAKCADLAGVLAGGALPSGSYNITPATAITPGQTATCTLNGPNSTSATFTGIGT